MATKSKAASKGFIYRERGMWRPGDDIYLTFVLHDKQGRIPATHLKPVIRTADEWAPESTVSVHVSEADGRPMTYTLAIVDEGLLGLTGYKTPNLHGQFYAREALGITTWDLFDYVAGAYSGELERLLALGGDGSAKEGEKQEDQKRFPPVVQFIGPFELKPKATARQQIRLPQYIGAVRVMVVAGEHAAYGSADKTVPVRRALSLLATLPRVLGPEEELTVPVSLFAMYAAIKNVTLKMEADKRFELLGSDITEVTFAKPGEQIALLKLKTRALLGNGHLRFVALSGKHRAKADLDIEIRSPNPPSTETVAKALKPGEAWEQDIIPHSIPGTSSVALEVSSLQPMNLEGRLGYLLQYPHGCLEQTTSSVFPQLYLPALLRLDEAQRKEIERNVAAGIDRLRQFQIANGGFSYWPRAGSDFNGWASSYAGHFLIEADKLGYHVPPHMLAGWITHQRELAQAWHAGGNESALEQAYRLYALADASQPVLGAMNRLRETPGLPTVARWQLAAAYKLAGQVEAAESLVRNVGIAATDYTEPGVTFGSRLRDQAIVLDSLIVLGNLDRCGPPARAVSEQLASGGWYSTQSTAYALLALGKLAGADKSGAVFTFEYAIGGNVRRSVRSDKPIHLAKWQSFPDAGAPIRVRNTSEKPIFVTVLTRGIAPAGEEKAAAAGLRIEASYADMHGNAIDPGETVQGSDFVARVTISNPDDHKLENLALTHAAPAGWEIHNTRLGSDQAKAPADIDYQDIRDDRVYSYFSLLPRESKTIELHFNAAYLGRYYLPAISVEPMYDAAKHASTKGEWIKVVRSTR